MTKLIDLILHCPIDIRESALAYGMPLREILADTTHIENFCYTDVQARLVWAKEVLSVVQESNELSDLSELIATCRDIVRKHTLGQLGDPGDSVLIDKLSNVLSSMPVEGK